MSRKNKWMSWLMMGFMLVMTLAPVIASAQGTPGPGDTFTLADDDLSKKTFIDPLFGPIISGGGESPLTGLMLVFNGVLLTVGGILVLYTILAGTMSSAHDGEMLGKRWSTLWVPVRTSLGAAAMMPVVGGGWCVAQVIVIWLAMQGAAMANVLWARFVDNGASMITAATYTPPGSLTSIRETYNTMFMNAVCVASKQGAREAAGTDAEIMGKHAYVGQIVADTPSRFWVAYGPVDMMGMLTASPMNPIAPTDCGLIAIEEETGAIGQVYNGLTNNTGAMLIDLRSDSPELTGPISEARRVELRRAKTEMDALAIQLVRSTVTQQEYNTKMNELLERYGTNVGSAANRVFSQHVNNDFIAKMKQDGWIMAGAFYLQMSLAQDQITRSITNAPVTVLPRAEDSRLGALSLPGMINAITPGVSEEEADLANAARLVSGAVSSASGGVAGVGQDSTSGGRLSTKFVNWFINEDSAFGVGTIDVNQNPVIMAKGLGEKMTATAWGALIAAGAAGLFTIGGAGVGTAVILAPIFMLFFSTLLVPGAILSTYLPLMPYIMWLGVVLAWAIMLIEAVVAAPLWALVHLAPDGDGAVGRGGQGYMLVLSLVLRPSLMIIGLVAAFVLMKPVGFLVNSTFVGAFTMSVQPGTFGLTQMIAGCVIYCIVMIILVQRVFSLIHVIPDRLLRWIGGDQGGVGEQAQAAGEGYQRAGAALGAHVALGQAGQSAIGQMGANARQQREINATKEGQQAQSIGNAERQLDEDWHQANASASKADRFEDANSQTAAASAFEKAGRTGFRTAEEQAKGDKSPESEKFLSGLEKARRESPEAAQNYMEQQGQQAEANQSAYSAARARLGSPDERPGDKATVDSHHPRQFQESLARGFAARREANARYAKLASGAGGGDDSVRSARENPPPGDARSGTDRADDPFS